MSKTMQRLATLANSSPTAAAIFLSFHSRLREYKNHCVSLRAVKRRLVRAGVEVDLKEFDKVFRELNGFVGVLERNKKGHPSCFRFIFTIKSIAKAALGESQELAKVVIKPRRPVLVRPAPPLPTTLVAPLTRGTIVMHIGSIDVECNDSVQVAELLRLIEKRA